MIASDNQAAIYLSKYPVASNHSKHIDNQYHVVRERVLRQEVFFWYCATGDNAADQFTKVVGPQQLLAHRAHLGLSP